MKLAQAIGLAVAAAGAAVAAVLLTRDGEKTAPVQAPVPTQEAASKPNPLAQLQATAEQGFDLAKQGLSFFNDLKAAISP